MQRRTFLQALPTLGAAAIAEAVSGTAVAARQLEAGLQASPTTLVLSGPGSQAIARLYNGGQIVADAQIRIKRWVQSDVGDVLSDTQSVVVSPPFAQVPPRATQIVRIADLQDTQQEGETAYRLLINQLPAVGALSGAEVQVLLAFSIPVFVQGKQQTPPDLAASLELRGSEGWIAIRNRGGTHARLSDVSVKGASGKTILAVSGLAGYALANSTGRIRISPEKAEIIANGTLYARTQLNDRPIIIPWESLDRHAQ